MKKVAFVAMLACTCGPVRAEIDLTPIASVRELEGCKFPQLEFRDGSTRITYETPKGWKYTSRDAHTLLLFPPDNGVVSARIQFLTTPARLILDAAQLKVLKDSAPSLIPPEGKIIGEPTITPNPIELDGRAACEIDILFALHAQRMHLSVLFVDLGESHLRFTLVTRASDFAELHKAFEQSWFSWQWLREPSPTAPQN